MAKPQGQIVCVGMGMILGAHMAPRCRSYIEQADIVYSSCHHLMQRWLEQLNINSHSLQPLYGKYKDRRETYAEMIEIMLASVRAGKRVVGAFYGHPGVFAQVPHRVVKLALEEGFDAHMEPGISAEACLYAEMNIDPGELGCQHFEASQFMFYQRIIDPYGYLVLWQIGLAGDLTLTSKISTTPQRQLLLDKLFEYYPPDHQVAIYESKTNVMEQSRIEWFALRDLVDMPLTMISTLVLPPARQMPVDRDMMASLHKITPRNY
ncbi:SAM-dependent methyltransferase [Alteromonas sp. ASW11-36]|uniref:SAM-dependent methyltransferase n=1 Tax=Alteromonas arenosi TaxID=3055817 RepID=A0ABT7SWQ0_9ALTE|nr:SAM-dependent methyltransferase [Alteromonas sp. ASW11-36]MDM7860621.1 SAM-dependent methyltransferase [Alteromonas sp. ASW11-36]